MLILDLHTARQIILQAQLLAPGSNLSGKEGALQVIKHLGYVQIDTISVVERAHHHILWTRVPDYQSALLQTLEDERVVFDYWSHAASYLPMDDFRFSLLAKQNMDEGSGFWRQSDPKLAAHVLQRIKTEGALMTKDFKKEKVRPENPWMTPIINQVVRQLFMKGELMVAGRKGILKTYDLPERVLPEGIPTSVPTRKEYLEHIVRRDLRAHGLVKLEEFGYLLRVPRKEFQAILKNLVKSGEVVEVAIRGLDGGPYFAFPETLQHFSPTNKKQFHILSPFDNLLIQRKRLAELFDFQYTIECYVPAAKRKFGYFGLPLLYGNKMAGLVDLKADRKTNVLFIRNLMWTVKPSQALLNAFDKKLQDFAKYCGCEEVVDQSGKMLP